MRLYSITPTRYVVMSRFNQLTRLLIKLCIQLLKLYMHLCVYVYIIRFFIYVFIYIYIYIYIYMYIGCSSCDPSFTSTKGRLRNVTADCKT